MILLTFCCALESACGDLGGFSYVAFRLYVALRLAPPPVSRVSRVQELRKNVSGFFLKKILSTLYFIYYSFGHINQAELAYTAEPRILRRA